MSFLKAQTPEDFIAAIAAALRRHVFAPASGIEMLVAEIDGALEHHELIKVKVGAADREERDALIGDLAQRTGAALVQRIGHVAVLYRPNPEKRQIVLPRG